MYEKTPWRQCNHYGGQRWIFQGQLYILFILWNLCPNIIITTIFIHAYMRYSHKHYNVKLQATPSIAGKRWKQHRMFGMEKKDGKKPFNCVVLCVTRHEHNISRQYASSLQKYAQLCSRGVDAMLFNSLYMYTASPFLDKQLSHHQSCIFTASSRAVLEIFF